MHTYESPWCCNICTITPRRPLSSHYIRVLVQFLPTFRVSEWMHRGWDAWCAPKVRPLSNRTGVMTRVLEGKPPARALTLGSRLFRPTSHHGNTHALALLALTPRRTWVAVRLQHARTVQSGSPMREAATLPAPPNATCGLPRRRPPSVKAVQQLCFIQVVPGCLRRAKDPAGLHSLPPLA